MSVNTYCKSQAGVCAETGCDHHMFTLRQIIELHYEYRKNATLVAFLDFSCAFDSLFHERTWEIHGADGLLEHLLNITKLLYTATQTPAIAFLEHWNQNIGHFLPA